MSRKHQTRDELLRSSERGSIAHETIPNTGGQHQREPEVGGFPWQFVTMVVAIALGLLSIVLSSVGVL